MADNGVFIALCYILQVFWIGKAKDEDGSEIPVKPEWTQTFAS
jgi:hypothetical protein